METSTRSTMLTWEAKPVRRGKRELIGLICPNCGGRALVSRSWGTNQQESTFKTRPCTYCWKASWLPGEHPDDKDKARKAREST